MLIIKRAGGIWEGWTWCMEATGGGSGDNIPGIYALIYTRYMLLNFHTSSPILLGDADLCALEEFGPRFFLQSLHFL